MHILSRSPDDQIYGWADESEIPDDHARLTDEEVADHLDMASTPAVPQVVTMRQARLALHSSGLLAQVDAAIDELPDPPRTEARIEWDFSSTVERGKPFVAMIGQALGLSESEMDALFIQAATL